MADPILEQYVKLTEFLGLALGPDYEIALHDLTDKNHSIIAIANGHVSGREVGAPLTNMALSILRDKSYETADYRLHYYGLSAAGKPLRSNTFLIKRGGEPIGMLCVNFDDSRYREVSAQLMGLCHPDSFVSEVVFPESAPKVAAGEAARVPEEFHNSTEAVAADAISFELDRIGVPPDRLTPEERYQIICNLEQNGVFLLKGTVRDVAERLCCSQATVYRYCRQAKEDLTARDGPAVPDAPDIPET